MKLGRHIKYVKYDYMLCVVLSLIILTYGIIGWYMNNGLNNIKEYRYVYKIYNGMILSMKMKIEFFKII